MAAMVHRPERTKRDFRKARTRKARSSGGGVENKRKKIASSDKHPTRPIDTIAEKLICASHELLFLGFHSGADLFKLLLREKLLSFREHLLLFFLYVVLNELLQHFRVS